MQRMLVIKANAEGSSAERRGTGATCEWQSVGVGLARMMFVNRRPHDVAAAPDQLWRASVGTSRSPG